MSGINLGGFPDSMRSLPNWVLWRLEYNSKKKRNDKIPYSAVYNGKAKSTSPDTWTTYTNAVKKYEENPGKYNGIGFVFSKETELVFVDIDHCIDEDGELDCRAEYILSELEEYAFVERSQSGTGLHLFVKGNIPNTFNSRKHSVEMYDTGRFCACTGDVFRDGDPFSLSTAAASDALSRVYERYKTDRTPLIIDTILLMGTEVLSDNEILKHASDNKGRSAAEFRELYSGGLAGQPSQSEADLRLCSILAYWSNRDSAAILRLIRQSGAMRKKWERKDYAERTISKACAECTETFSEWKAKKAKEAAADYEQYIKNFW